MGRCREAQPWLERAIEQMEQGDLAGRVNHDSVGTSLHELGACLADSGDYEGAKHWFDRAIAECERGDLLGRVDHQISAKSLGYLARCHAETGNVVEALSLAERAIAEHHQGDKHGRINTASLALFLRNAAYYLRQLNRIPEAEAYESEANQLDPPKP